MLGMIFETLCGRCGKATPHYTMSGWCWCLDCTDYPVSTGPNSPPTWITNRIRPPRPSTCRHKPQRRFFSEGLRADTAAPRAAANPIADAMARVMMRFLDRIAESFDDNQCGGRCHGAARLVADECTRVSSREVL